MKIVTPGKVYLFKCECCGCEFVEGKERLHPIKCIKTKLPCPCCGNEVEGIEEDKIFQVVQEEDET